MQISAPEEYFGKKIRVTSTKGIVRIGELFGFDYDYDNDGNEFLEFDVEIENGFTISYTEGEIERIDILA